LRLKRHTSNSTLLSDQKLLFANEQSVLVTSAQPSQPFSLRLRARLPKDVWDTARFGGGEAFYARSFLRVPIMPQSAALYGTQLTGLIRQGDLTNTARLGLLPWLATAAFVGQKITGAIRESGNRRGSFSSPQCGAVNEA
jgi:hypothetical protein